MCTASCQALHVHKLLLLLVKQKGLWNLHSGSAPAALHSPCGRFSHTFQPISTWTAPGFKCGLAFGPHANRCSGQWKTPSRMRSFRKFCFTVFRVYRKKLLFDVTFCLSDFYLIKQQLLNAKQNQNSSSWNLSSRAFYVCPDKCTSTLLVR